MKWLPPTGSTQGTSCGKFVVVQANSKDWIAYALSPYGIGEELGVKASDEDARACCEDHEREMTALRRAG